MSINFTLLVQQNLKIVSGGLQFLSLDDCTDKCQGTAFQYLEIRTHNKSVHFGKESERSTDLL